MSTTKTQHPMQTVIVVLIWIMQFIAAGVFLMASWGKFNSHPDSVTVFSKLGMEPIGRYIIALLELLSAASLLNKHTAAVGATLGFAIMLGALIAHTTHLGLYDQDGSPKMVLLMFYTLVSTSVISFYRRREIPLVGNSF